MKCGRGLIALLLALTAAGEVRAQFPGFFVPSGGFGSSLTYTRFGRRSHFSLSLGGPSYAGYGPYGYGFSSFNSFMLYSPPPLVVAQPVIINQPIVVNQPAPEEDRDVFVIRPRQRGVREVWPEGKPPAEMPEAPLPGAPAGGFRPVLPEDRARALQPAANEERLRPPAMLPRPPAPEADPQAENARQIALGKQALANQEYGRAAERFRQATIVAPAEAQAHFFLAQAYFAIGKYREAVAAIQAGLNLQPDWPSAKFRPKDLYGANVAEFPEHLQRLAEALKRHAEDPVLLFLYGYQLWFDGRQDEARRLFEQAARLVPDPSFIELFLKARRDMAVEKKP